MGARPPYGCPFTLRSDASTLGHRPSQCGDSDTYSAPLSHGMPRAGPFKSGRRRRRSRYWWWWWWWLCQCQSQLVVAVARRSAQTRPLALQVALPPAVRAYAESCGVPMPPHSLRSLFRLPCGHMLLLPQSLRSLVRLPCRHMLLLPHSLHLDGRAGARRSHFLCRLLLQRGWICAAAVAVGDQARLALACGSYRRPPLGASFQVLGSLEIKSFDVMDNAWLRRSDSSDLEMLRMEADGEDTDVEAVDLLRRARCAASF